MTAPSTSRAPRGSPRHLVDHGHDGVVVSGTTGESPTTTVSEDGDILRAVIDAVGDRASVVAGVGTNATAHSVELARQAEKLGADGLLLVTPYYNKPGQAGVLHHFRSVVESTGVPVMLYDVPGRTATQIDLDTYAAAKEWDTVVAVKDAVGDYARGVKIMQLGYDLYSGDDVATLGWLAHGAQGVVSVVGHAAGRDAAPSRPVCPFIECTLPPPTVSINSDPLCAVQPSRSAASWCSVFRPVSTVHYPA